MGGVLEALVKKVKRASRTFTRDCLFSEVALTTFLCDIESIVSQRSLTLNSVSIDNFEALTPYNFVLGLPSSNSLAEDFNESHVYMKTKWKAVQTVTNIFGRRCTIQYLGTLVSEKMDKQISKP